MNQVQLQSLLITGNGGLYWIPKFYESDVPQAVLNSRMCTGMKRDLSISAHTHSHSGMCTSSRQASAHALWCMNTHLHTFALEHPNFSGQVFIQVHICLNPPAPNTHTHTAGCRAATWHRAAQHASMLMKITLLPTHTLTPVVPTDRTQKSEESSMKNSQTNRGGLP